MFNKSLYHADDTRSLLWKANRKSYAIYQMVSFPMTLNEPVFKVTPLFDAKYLTNGYRYGHRRRI